MVCRLTEQKGFGYILPILDDLIKHNVQMVIVGTGDPKVCMDLGEFAQQHPDQFAFINGFSSEHAHLVEAGADFFLMPSQFEPWIEPDVQLSYGTIPIVRSVGDQRHGYDYSTMKVRVLCLMILRHMHCYLVFVEPAGVLRRCRKIQGDAATWNANAIHLGSGAKNYQQLYLSTSTSGRCLH